MYHFFDSFTLEDESLNEIIGNCLLSERFLSVARDMDTLEPKTPEDIYKVDAVVLPPLFYMLSISYVRIVVAFSRERRTGPTWSKCQ